MLLRSRSDYYSGKMEERGKIRREPSLNEEKKETDIREELEETGLPEKITSMKELLKSIESETSKLEEECQKALKMVKFESEIMIEMAKKEAEIIRQKAEKEAEDLKFRAEVELRIKKKYQEERIEKLQKELEHEKREDIQEGNEEIEITKPVELVRAVEPAQEQQMMKREESEEKLLHEKAYSSEDVKRAREDKFKSMKKRRIKKRIEKIFLSLFVLIAVTIILFQTVFGIMVVNGSSMEPTLQDGYKVIYNRLSKDAERGSLIIFEKVDGIKCVKRVIGIEGDEVDIDDFTGEVLVNGEVVVENIDTKTYLPENAIAFPVKVEKNSYFVLGDNRENSVDSREDGLVKKSNIKGKIAWTMK